MTNEQLTREVNYGALAHIAKRLLASGLISEREYCKICMKYEGKYAPLIGGIIGGKEGLKP